VAVVAALLCATGPVGCWGEAPPRANVLMVVFDTTRADDWSIFEPDRRVTPVLDAIGARSHRFSNAWSLYSVTVPSHVSLFTGHAMRLDLEHALAADGGATDAALADPRYDYVRSSLFTILREQGYRTYAFSGNEAVRKSEISALDAVDVSALPRPYEQTVALHRRLMEHYGTWRASDDIATAAELHARRRNRGIIGRNAEHINGEVLRAMREHAATHADRPFMLFVNYNDAHDPYVPEPPWDRTVASSADSVFQGDLWDRGQRRFKPRLRGLALSMSSAGLEEEDIERARALHLGGLAYADHHLGLLIEELEALGLMESTVVVALADHGEAFGEGGRMAHGGFGGEDVERALLHVPLVIRLPDASLQPTVHDERVDLRDVKPTLLEYLGIDDDSSRGRSLLALMRGAEDSLAPAALRPQDVAPETIGDNLIPGQDPETTERLEQQLRALGYLE
jgi:arylsulfatase A-like enzyme